MEIELFLIIDHKPALANGVTATGNSLGYLNDTEPRIDEKQSESRKQIKGSLIHVHRLEKTHQ